MNTRKNRKTQRGGMKPLLTMDLNKTYDDNEIRALFRDNKDVSDFLRKTGKIIQMPVGLEAKLYENGQLCFNTKRVTDYPIWMTMTFQLNGIIPPPPPPDRMSTILSIIIQTDKTDQYEMSKGRDDLLCMRKMFSKSSKQADLKMDINQFVMEFIHAHKYLIELDVPIARSMQDKKMVMKEELSLSFLDDFDAVIHALPPFISERRKRELIGLKRNAMRSHTSEYTDEFKTNMEDLARKLIELNYMMENCNRHDQGAFDECKLVAEDVGIVTKILSTPSVLINRVNEEYDKLIQLSQPPLKQPKQSNKQLKPQPQLSEEEWMDRLFVNPQSSSPPVRNQFDDLLPAGGRRRNSRRKQSRRKRMQSKRMRSKRMRSSS